MKDLQNIGNAGEYFAAYILSANGFTTTITLGRAEKFDIIAVDNKTKKTLLIQVKTLSGEGPQFRMSPKNAEIEEKNFYYFFVRLNNLRKEQEPDYWIFPNKLVAQYVKEGHKKWLKTPGMHGQKHNDGPWRSFRIKSDKYTPKNWTQTCKNYYKNVKILLQ